MQTKCTPMTYQFYLQHVSINGFRQLNHNQHSAQNINVTKTYIRIKCTLPRLKWYITITIQCSVWEARHTQRLAIKQSARTFACVYQVVYEYNLASTVHNT